MKIIIFNTPVSLIFQVLIGRTHDFVNFGKVKS